MIPYDDLVAALASWRARQGLPVVSAPTAGSGPTAGVPTSSGDSGAYNAYASGGSGGYASGGSASGGSGGYASGGSGGYASGGSGGYASGGSGGYASGGSGGYASGGSGAYSKPGSGPVAAKPGSGPTRATPPSAPPKSGGYQPPPLETADESLDVDDEALLEEAHYENEGADFGMQFDAPVERDDESTTLGQAPTEPARDSFGGETELDPGLLSGGKPRKPW